MPEGLILDDMYQPLGIVEQGYRSVVDTRARVYDIWPKTSRGEFARKVRTLAGNLQLLQLAPWLLTSENRLRLQLVSHKVLRLVVPFLLIMMVLTSALLSGSSTLYATLLMLQLSFYFLGGVGFGRGLPWLRRITGAASAFCMLNAAVVVGFYKFLFSRGPLWKIWTSDSTNLLEHRNTVISLDSKYAEHRSQAFDKEVTEIENRAQASGESLRTAPTRVPKNTPGRRTAA